MGQLLIGMSGGAIVGLTLLAQLSINAFVPARILTAQQRSSAKTVTYQFSEVAPPGPGSTQVKVYRIAVSKAANGSSATIDVEGFQTATYLTARVKQTAKNRMGFFFVSYRPGNLFKLYKPGDLLLELETLPNRKIKIIFGELRSLYENRREYIPNDLQIN
jgi:hypothetical protein